MMQAFNLLILILSIIHTGFAKPGKHFLIETDDAAKEDVAHKDEHYVPPYLPDKKYKEKKDCEPNKEWKEKLSSSNWEKGCKACSCSPDGKVVECTSYAVSPLPTSNQCTEGESDIVEAPVDKETDDAAEEEGGAGDFVPEKCEPNKEWKGPGCAKCKCTPDGKGSQCVGCPSGSICQEKECVQQDMSDHCEPNKEWKKNGCQNCTCLKKHKGVQSPPFHCLGQVAKNGCATAGRCYPDGKGSWCVGIFRMDPHNCMPNEKWKQPGCTYENCKCWPDGKGSECSGCL